MTKAMDWYFVGHFHKVMKELIVVLPQCVLQSVVVEFHLQTHRYAGPLVFRKGHAQDAGILSHCYLLYRAIYMP